MNTVSGKIKNFTDLYAWQEGHKLVLAVYKATEDFPGSERFGLVSQMRRAAVSITSNIAEGFSRETYKDKAHFYSMSLGSLTEIENQVIVARDLSYINELEYEALCDQSLKSNKIIRGLIKKSHSFYNPNS